MCTSVQLAPLHLNSLVNFCFKPFVSNACCSAVTADGFSPSNLITEDSNMRSRGLRVEHFIRPPLTLTIDLYVPVDVCCVLLCPDLPQDAEMMVEMSGCSSKDGVSLFRLCPGPMIGRRNSLVVGRNKQHREMSSVARLAHLVAHSYGCQELMKLEHIESPLTHVSVLRKLRHLQLKVIKWSGPKPVGIKWLEIWGVVSTACSRKEMTLFQSKFSAPFPTQLDQPLQNQPPGVFRCEEGPSTAAVCVDQAQAVEDSPLAQDKRGQDIPEQFLDELTFEFMSFPVLLPSGHCVDQSTVDRLASNDAMYGRPPTDPFTGLDN